MKKEIDNTKIIKYALKNEIAPLLIGLRNEFKETNKNIIDAINSKKDIDSNAVWELLKGKDGYTPQKGKDYFTEDEKIAFIKFITPKKGVDYMDDTQIIDFIRSIRPIKGKDYFTIDEIKSILTKATPVKGKHYFTKTEIKEFLKAITPVKGVHYKDGIDGVTKTVTEFADISATDVRDKLESLKGSSRLSIKAIKGLQEAIDSASVSKGSGGIGGSGNQTGGSDEKVKLNASDPTAGYLDDKIGTRTPVTIAYSPSITPIFLAQITIKRIIATGDLTINIPTGGTDGANLELWITANGADRQLTVGAGIKIPTSSVFTSPQTISSGKKAKLLLQYDATLNGGQWELTSFVNGY